MQCNDRKHVIEFTVEAHLAKKISQQERWEIVWFKKRSRLAYFHL